MTAQRPRGLFAVLACGLVLFSFGCGGSKPTKVVVPKDGLPAGTPINDSEAHLMTRFDATFDAQSEGEYAKLLTDDFRFHFSSATNPDLALAYGDNWRLVDETITIGNLFAGFTNSADEVIPGASAVAMELTGIAYQSDASHPDSTAHYRKVIVSKMTMAIEVPGSPEPTIYNIDARQEFYIVRGDAAVLSAGQPAQIDRWYIRRWDDLSVPIFPSLRKSPTVDAASPSTLGSLKARYR